MKITIVALIVALCQVDASHLLVGNTIDITNLVKQEKVQYFAIPFLIRSKKWFYSDPADKKITGIRCVDLMRSHTKVSITAGGVGFSFVNLQFESERGRGIDYDVAIYAKPDY